jgi:membrane protease YdiL (CAAX protease family)
MESPDIFQKLNPVQRAIEPTYANLTRTGTYSFLMSLPLLIIYEVLMLLKSDGIALGADVWIKTLLYQLGIGGMMLFGAVVLLIGGVIYLYERPLKIPVIPRFFPIMIVESLIYGVILAFLISNLVGAIFYGGLMYDVPALQVAETGGKPGFLTQLALSIGAGLYEEFVFRLMLVGGLAFVFKRIFKNEIGSYIVAALIGAFIFSLVHYIGALGDAFTLPSFTFRLLMGLALNVLFIARGFGIAAWTHSLYDVLVVTVLS